VRELKWVAVLWVEGVCLHIRQKGTITFALAAAADVVDFFLGIFRILFLVSDDTLILRINILIWFSRNFENVCKKLISQKNKLNFQQTQ
jgi:hypothetical protein